VPSFTVAKSLLARILDANADYLPQFRRGKVRTR
jgi:hypothetical protein